MKKILFFLMVFCTYYLAAMYRYLPLLALCGMEVAGILLSFFLPLLFRRRLRVFFPEKSEFLRAGSSASCVLRAEYPGRLPSGRFVVFLEAGYVTGGKVARKKISGSCGRGEEDLPFHFRASGCGLLSIRARGVRVYDYFSLFSADKPLAEEIQAAVFPAEYVLDVTMPVSEEAGNDPAGERADSLPGEVLYEIRQNREYRTGDSTRHIHWNLSARMDGLWIKEYGRETDLAVRLLLEPEGFMEAGTEALSRFYTLLYALLQGFLQNTAVVYLYWFHIPAGKWEMARIADGTQCREALLCLYRMRAQGAEAPGRKKEAVRPPFCSTEAFRLDMDLAWYFNQTLIYRFSARNLEQELREKVFVL